MTSDNGKTPSLLSKFIYSAETKLAKLLFNEAGTITVCEENTTSYSSKSRNRILRVMKLHALLAKCSQWIISYLHLNFELKKWEVCSIHSVARVSSWLLNSIVGRPTREGSSSGSIPVKRAILYYKNKVKLTESQRHKLGHRRLFSLKSVVL